MSTPSKSRLTWFRFNLRSLFVVMTLVACWFGWQVNTVHKRQELLRELKNKPNFSVVLNHPIGLGSNRPYASVSITRRWLGNVSVHRIIVAGSLNATNSPTFRRLKQLFPEAEFTERGNHPPCHPGCFPRGTLVNTPSGNRAIESLKPGDTVIALQADHTIAFDNIHAVFVTDNQLWKVSTDSGDIITTKTQPLCMSFGRIVPVESIQIGDDLLQYRNGKTRTVKVQAIEMTDRHEDVFNLILSDAVFFVASNFVARAKPPAEPGHQEITDHRHSLTVKK